MSGGVSIDRSTIWPYRGGEPGRSRATFAYSSTIGAAEGSIIAAIIVTQTPRYQPSPPSAVPGPASMPAMRWTVTIQATSASPSRAAAAAVSRPSALIRARAGRVR